MYLTYDEYLSYGGAMPESDYPHAEFKARKRIDYMTASRVALMEQVPEAVKLCMASLIKAEEKIGVEAQIENPLIASFNTDGYSESYGSAADQMTAVNQALDNSIRTMLFGELDDKGVPLLYRGLDL